MQKKEKINFYDHLEKDNTFSKSDMDNIWQKTAGYKQEWKPNSNAAFAKFKANVMEAESEAKQITLPKRKSSPFVWRVAAGIALVVGMFVFANNFTNSGDANRAVASTTLTTQNVLLADGSNVQLNKASTLMYDEDMSTARRVKLEGEAFFDIEKNPALPFEIEANNTTVKVLGTSFNVRAVEHNITEVEVATGLVEVTSSTGDKVLLNPYERAVVVDGKITKTTVTALNSLAWLSGELNFKNAQLKDVSTFLERSFNKEIVLPQHLENCHITLKMSTDNMDALLENITLAIGINYHVEKDKIIFSGEGC